MNSKHYNINQLRIDLWNELKEKSNFITRIKSNEKLLKQSLKELLEILHDLREKPDKIKEIALAGKMKYEELFSAEVFWNLVLK